MANPTVFGSNRAVASDYRFSRPLAARLAGFALACLGLVVFAVTVAVGLLGMPVVVLTVTVAAAAAVILAVAVVLARRPAVVRLDETGYRVRLVRGVGTAEARWSDVEDVVATTVAGERCVVLRLRDGRTTTVPVRVLEADPDAFVRELASRLDRGHGYRRVR